MLVLACVTDDHEIVPEPGTAHRVRDSEPADLKNPLHYPIVAVCLTCGRPIRTERWLLDEWRHIERFSNPEGS
jgi:hypothetical protein